MKKAFFLLTFSSFSGAGFTFLTQILLARILSQSEFGAFFTALSLVMLISPIGGFGVGALMLKVFGEEGWGAIRWLRPALNFILVSCTFALIIYSCIPLILNNKLINQILPIISLVVIAQASLEYTSALFQLEKKYTELALFQLFPHVMRFLLVFAFWLVYSDRVNVFIISQIYLIISIITIITSWFTIKRATKGNLALSDHKKPNNFLLKNEPSMTEILRKALPFGIAGFLYLIYFQGNVVLIQNLLGNDVVAQYGIALTIIAGIQLLPVVIYQKLLLPSMHIWSYHDKEKLKGIYFRGNIIMALTGGGISLTLISISSPLVIFLFGDNFENSYKILKVLALSIPFTFVANSFGAILTTKNSIIQKNYCIGIASIMSLVIGFILTVKFGIIGTSYSFVLIEIFLFFSYFLLIKRQYPFLSLRQTN